MSQSTARKRPLWKRIPLYVQILIALILGVGLGLLLAGGGQLSPHEANLAQNCRTAINVMGDMTVSALLDGKHPKEPEYQLEPDRETVEMR